MEVKALSMICVSASYTDQSQKALSSNFLNPQAKMYGLGNPRIPRATTRDQAEDKIRDTD